MRTSSRHAGVTTELTGQCGLSMAPVMPENLAAVQNMLSMGTTWFPDDMKNWSSFARFLEYADQQKLTQTPRCTSATAAYASP